jgi:hypothetical protein
MMASAILNNAFNFCLLNLIYLIYLIFFIIKRELTAIYNLIILFMCKSFITYIYIKVRIKKLEARLMFKIVVNMYL